MGLICNSFSSRVAMVVSWGMRNHSLTVIAVEERGYELEGCNASKGAKRSSVCRVMSTLQMAMWNPGQ
jgi:hypothetical protein